MAFTEHLYLSAPYDTPEQQAVIERLKNLLEEYAFQVFCPQSLFLDAPTDPEALAALEKERLDAVNHTKLMLTVFHGNRVHPSVAHEIELACSRYIKVLGLNCPENLNPEGNPASDYTGKLCTKVIDVPEDDEVLLDPLLSQINMYYGA
ncbi:MAG: hypothetical protein KTR14_04260 [Vampirovibrio sp.]|nr:hypothetical protein [Vampirovibrio sp.]